MIKNLILGTPNWILGPILVASVAGIFAGVVALAIVIDFYAGLLLGLQPGAFIFFCLIVFLLGFVLYQISGPIAQAFKNWMDS